MSNYYVRNGIVNIPPDNNDITLWVDPTGEYASVRVHNTKECDESLRALVREKGFTPQKPILSPERLERWHKEIEINLNYV